MGKHSKPADTRTESFQMGHMQTPHMAAHEEHRRQEYVHIDRAKKQRHKANSATEGWQKEEHNSNAKHYLQGADHHEGEQRNLRKKITPGATVTGRSEHFEAARKAGMMGQN